MLSFFSLCGPGWRLPGLSDLEPGQGGTLIFLQCWSLWFSPRLPVRRSTKRRAWSWSSPGRRAYSFTVKHWGPSSGSTPTGASPPTTKLREVCLCILFPPESYLVKSVTSSQMWSDTERERDVSRRAGRLAERVWWTSQPGLQASPTTTGGERDVWGATTRRPESAPRPGMITDAGRRLLTSLFVRFHLINRDQRPAGNEILNVVVSETFII